MKSKLIKNLYQLICLNKFYYVLDFAYHYFKSKSSNLHLYNYEVEEIKTYDIMKDEVYCFNNQKEIVCYAEQVLSHKVDVLGYNQLFVCENINWHKDFIRNIQWDKTINCKAIRKETKNLKGDIKIPWELSRLQHLMVLGQAYIITKDEKYAKEYYTQIMSWIEKNPIEYGVNWSCTMDVAIRAVNMLVTSFYFSKSKSIPKVFWDTLTNSLYQHMIFIRHNLELGIVNGNHYLADLCGLIFLGRFFYNTNKGKNIFEFAKKRFLNEMDNQVYPDGTDHEGSTSYHALVTELFLYTMVFLKKWGITVPKKYLVNLRSMIETLKVWMKPDGTIPLIGDADDGRFIKYSQSKTIQPKHLIILAAVFFEDSQFKLQDTRDNELNAVEGIYGEEGLQLYNSLISKNVIYKSKAFSDSGYFIFRDNKFYLFVRAGNIGLKGRGGHGHCDQLSFELNINGTDIFVDPGSYIYTGDPEMRNLFRSTAYHNTVVVDGMEQNHFDKQKLFAMENETKTKVIKCFNGVKEEYLIAEHYGYQKKVGIVHRREFRWNREKQELVITDQFKGKGRHQLEWFFHLGTEKYGLDIDHPGVIAIKHTNCSVCIEYDSSLNIGTQEGFVSRAYGVKNEAQIIRLSNRVNLEQNNIFTFRIIYSDGE